MLTGLTGSLVKQPCSCIQMLYCNMLVVASCVSLPPYYLCTYGLSSSIVQVYLRNRPENNDNITSSRSGARKLTNGEPVSL